MKNVIAALALLGSVITGAPTQAAVIDFDDLDGAGTEIANGYAGLQWENFFSLDPWVDMPMSGYNFAITSGKNIAYSGYDQPAAIGGLSGSMLDYGYFTAAFSDGLTITARGYDGAGGLLQEKVFSVTTVDPTRIDFGWSGMSRVVFAAEGGIDQFFDMSGPNFALDDLSISPADVTAPVPEPATWAMMLLGFAVVGGTMRRRSMGLHLA